MKVELHGIELRGYHGVLEEERRDGQLFLYDVELEVGDRGANDRIEDAVDYRDVAATVREVNDRQHKLLEALASATAEAILERFPVERVRVRVRKPEVHPAGLDVEFSAVTVERSVTQVTVRRPRPGSRLRRARREPRRPRGDDQAGGRADRRPAPLGDQRDRAVGGRRPAAVSERGRRARDHAAAAGPPRTPARGRA